MIGDANDASDVDNDASGVDDDASDVDNVACDVDNDASDVDNDVNIPGGRDGEPEGLCEWAGVQQPGSLPCGRSGGEVECGLPAARTSP